MQALLNHYPLQPIYKQEFIITVLPLYVFTAKECNQQMP